MRASFRLAPFDIQLYRVADGATEGLLYFMVVFGPWAFGTTQGWSIWTMNTCGYALGLLLGVKLSIRWLKGYQPPRWEAVRANGSTQRRTPPASGVTRALAVLTGLVLLYCLVSASNAQANYREDLRSFEYFPCVRWLPHSFDRTGTWCAFWMYLGLAAVFWAARDWLLGKSSAEVAPFGAGRKLAGASPLPVRVQRLLWMLALNGALIGLEGIVQRLVHSPRLLFVVQPRIHQSAESQFGPYAYRSNAAQYFNLLWPVCIGYWWTLQRNVSRLGARYHLLLLWAGIMAACPIISTSRAGALVCVGIALAAVAMLATFHLVLSPAYAHWNRKPQRRLALVAVFLGVGLLSGFAVGWPALAPRLAELNDGFAGRELMYAAARPIAQDYPWFGTGPGTFETVSLLYPRPEMFWPPQLHNDWLETRITFGMIGTTLLGLVLVLIPARWFCGGCIHGGRRFVGLSWLALGGCLVHARYDFPLQIYSVVFLFVLVCALLFTLSRRP